MNQNVKLALLFLMDIVFNYTNDANYAINTLIMFDFYP